MHHSLRSPLVFAAVAATVAVAAGALAQTERRVATGARLAPAGEIAYVPGRPNDVAFSPDGRFVAVKTTHAVVLFDARTHRQTGIVLTRDLNAQLPRSLGGGGSFGLVWMPDGHTLWISNSFARLHEVVVAEDGALRWGRDLRMTLPRDAQSTFTAPTGIALDPASGQAYVALGNAEAVDVVDLEHAARIRRFPVCPAPAGVAIAAGRLFVSCQGTHAVGARPQTLAPSGPSTVSVDARGVAKGGTVEVYDLATPLTHTSIALPAGPAYLRADAAGAAVFVASPQSDDIFRIDARAVRKERFSLAGSHPGVIPNAVAPDAETVWVTAAGINQVLHLDAKTGARLGTIDTLWYPSAVAAGADGTLVVASMKGDGTSSIEHGFAPTVSRKRKGGFNVYDFAGTVQFIAHANDATHAAVRPAPALLAALPHIEHVVYIIKENRSYDEMLGDMPEGDGDRSLCQFCNVTPNHHALAREFGLFDGFRVNGTLSADGHQWTSQDSASDYVERAMGGFPRSYPSDGTDPLAYSAGGFLWDRVLDAGLTFRDYGEFITSGPPIVPAETWSQFYDDYRHGRHVRFTHEIDIARLRPHVAPSYPAFDLRIPDQVRADAFIGEMHGMWRRGAMPALSLLLMGNDHTAGEDAGFPTPRAAVADNDLALGRIVEALTHGPFWKTTAIFVVEDDAQAGLDHLDAHRSVAFVISPYTRGRGADHRFINQSSVVRCIERALHLAPMTMFDEGAPDLAHAFGTSADLRPYVAARNVVRLDEMNPAAPAKTAVVNPVRPDAGDVDALRDAIWHSTRPASAAGS